MLTLLAASAQAQPAAAPAAPAAEPSPDKKESARSLMQVGDQKFASEDYRGALEAYEAADAIMRAPTTGLAVGRARARLGLLVQAVDVLQRVARHPVAAAETAALAKAREEAKKLDADLAYRIPTLRVVVKGVAADTPVEIRIDGSPLDPKAHALPARVNPGPHVLDLAAAGYRSEQRSVRLEESQRMDLEIALEHGEPPPAPPQPPAAEAVKPPPPAVKPLPAGPPAPARPEPAEQRGLPVVSWVGFGVGAAGLIAGAITGGLSLAQAGELKDQCPGDVCTEDKRGDYDQMMLLANVSNVGFAVGAVGVGVGLLGLVLGGSSGDGSPAEAAAIPVELLVGPARVGVGGRF
ncbi:MAG: hypothetical protein HY744_24885 [Deltaproteobacteria bacterium]|nr:hypothetical protein [Deltaproteobacteria bacterium]